MKPLRPTLSCLLLALLSLCVAAGATAATSPAAQLQANKRAATHDALQHLASVRLPGDVTRISREPGFAKAFAVSVPRDGAVSANDSALWSTAASPQSILAYAKAHRPAGSTLDQGSGSGSDSKTGVSSVDIQFSWPDRGQVLNRLLTLTVVTPRHGDSVIAAQSTSAWFVPRQPSEMVPAGVHAIEIVLSLGPNPTGPVVRPGGHIRTTSRLVDRASTVQALIKRFDALPIVQPSLTPLACPLILAADGSGLTLDFKTSAHGRTLAQAQVSAHHGSGFYDGAGACDPIDFTIGSRRHTELTSPTFVKQIGQLIGANIS